MDRYLQSTPATLTTTWYSNGTAVDPGVVTVTVTRDDGTTVVTSQTASGTGATARTFNLTTTHTATLDILTATWVSSAQGTLKTYAEIVGGFLFGLSEARALKPLDSTTKYPTADLIAARTLAETALEDACRIAFVPRYAREVRSGRGGTDLLPKRPRALSIQSVTIGGTVVTDAVVDDEDGAAAATFYRPTGWPQGRRNIEVRYTHGWPAPPPRVGRACLLLAKRFLVDTPISDRTTMMAGQDGTRQFFVTAGVRDAVFDVPECNAVVQEYGLEYQVG